MFLLVLLTFVMLIRPGELSPDFATLPIYLMVILVTIAANLETLLAQLRSEVIYDRAVLAAVFGVLVCGCMSHMTSLRIYFVRMFFDEFVRIVIFYMLLTGVVKTESRLMTMMMWVAIFSVIEVGMAVADYDGYYDFPAITHVDENFTDPATGVQVKYVRMCGSGLFADPNDICGLIVVAVTLSLYFLLAGFSGIFWAIPIGFMFYGLTLTHSRGGLMALMVAVFAVMLSRFGWKKMMPLTLIAVPAILALGGRQTSIDTSSGTGQDRIQLWVYGFQGLISNRAPLFGTGVGTYAEFTGGLHAHNSFIQAYVESGYIGGTCFFAMFHYPMISLLKLRKLPAGAISPELARLGDFLIGMLSGTAVSMMSLTRNLSVPIYLFIGLIDSYIQIVRSEVPNFLPVPDSAYVKRLFRDSFIFLAILYTYSRFSVRFGG